MLVWLLACQDPVPRVSSADPDLATWLTRLSLDLRGVRPRPEELDQAEATGAVPIDAWLHDARFGGRLRDLFAPIYRTRQDSWPITGAEYGVDDEAAFARSVGEEPLMLLSAIAEDDRPYPEIVRADWTMADEHSAAASPTDYPDGATGWRRVRYTDGRAAAGVLSTNGMWWRYTTTASNASRGRANAITRILICHDYLERSVEFDPTVDLSDLAGVRDALRTNPSCVACHAALDPLASFLTGFSPLQGDRAFTPGLPPAWYGTPGDDLGDLGRAIANDPRLSQCVTRQVYESLLGRPATIEDTGALLAHHAAFAEEALTLRALFRSVVASDAYRAREPRPLSVEQLGTALEDLTGFRFTTDGYDLLTTEAHGVRSLADGVDGVFATRPVTSPTPTSVLVQARVSQAAALSVVEHDRASPATARLFTGIDFTETPTRGRDAVEAQLRSLRERVLGGFPADAPEVAEDLALWEELYALDGDPAAAWAGVLSVLLREPAFLLY